MDDSVDVHLIGGDLTNAGAHGGLTNIFKDFHNKPLIVAVGNHDMVSVNHNIMNFIDNYNDYYVVGDIGIMTAYVFYEDFVRSLFGVVCPNNV